LFDFVVAHLQQFVERRGVMVGDDQCGVQFFEIVDGLRAGFGRGAEEEHAILLFRGDAQQEWHEVGAGDAFEEWVAEEARGPNERGAVAEDEVGIEQDAAEFDVFLGLDEEIDVGGDEVVRLARGDHAVDGFDGLGSGDVVEGHAEDGDGRVRVVGAFWNWLVHYLTMKNRSGVSDQTGIVSGGVRGKTPAGGREEGRMAEDGGLRIDIWRWNRLE
jgi:hypothetical protein